MEITVPVSDMQALIKRHKPAVNARGALPVLSGMRIMSDGKTTTATTTDLELTIESGVNAGTSGKGGTMVVPFKPLTKFVGALPKDGKVTLSQEIISDKGNTPLVTLTCEQFSITMQAPSADEFPRVVGMDDSKHGKKGKIDFAAINSVIEAASDDAHRPILTGVYITGNEYVATDSYRLYVTQSPTDSKITALVPQRVFKALPKWQGVHEVSIGDRWIRFENEGVRVHARTIDGDYPNYKGLIPSHDNTLIEFDDPDYTATLTTMAKVMGSLIGPTEPMVFEQGSPVKIRVGREPSGSFGDMRMNTEIPGKAEATVAFNFQYLTSALKGAIDVDKFTGIDSLKPMVIRWVDGEYTHQRLLMPIRVQ